jgi:hypothetical protein
VTRGTHGSDASADRAKSAGLSSGWQMMAESNRRDLEGGPQDGGVGRHRKRLGLPRTAGEMAVQASFNHHSNFSSQQGLVRLVGHREPR